VPYSSRNIPSYCCILVVHVCSIYTCSTFIPRWLSNKCNMILSNASLLVSCVGSDGVKGLTLQTRKQGPREVFRQCQTMCRMQFTATRQEKVSIKRFKRHARCKEMYYYVLNLWAKPLLNRTWLWNTIIFRRLLHFDPLS